MLKTDRFIVGVEGILDKARLINPAIGEYLSHFINTDYRLIVWLSGKGAIEIPTDTAHTFEICPDLVSEEQIQEIAKSFWQAY